MDLKQFKLANGEEIVCEVIEWHDDDVADIIIRNAYKIIAYHGSATGDRYYAFAPWMVYQEGDEIFQSINAEMVVGSATPTEMLIREYLKVKESDKSTQEEIDRKINEYVDNIQKMLLGLDKQTRKYELLDSDGKVVAFPDRGKIH